MRQTKLAGAAQASDKVSFGLRIENFTRPREACLGFGLRKRSVSVRFSSGLDFPNCRRGPAREVLVRGGASGGDFQSCFVGFGPPLCFPRSWNDLLALYTPPDILFVSQPPPFLPGFSAPLLFFSRGASSLGALQLFPLESYFDLSRSFARVPQGPARLLCEYFFQ